MRYEFRSQRVEFGPGGQIVPLGIIFYASTCLFSVQEFIFGAMRVYFGLWESYFGHWE